MNQEQQIISPMVARRERKGMARYSVKNALGEQMAEQIVEGGGGGGVRVGGRPAGGGRIHEVYLFVTDTIAEIRNYGVRISEILLISK